MWTSPVPLYSLAPAMKIGSPYTKFFKKALQDMNEKEGSIDRHFSSFFIHSFIVLDDLIRNNSIMLMLAHGRVWLRKNSSRLGKSSVAIVYMFAKKFVSTMPTTSCAT